ncbi:hypothetical protein, partial [Limosilactobacillus fastidiosus]
TQEQNNDVYDQQMKDYNQQIAKLGQDQHITGSGTMTNGSFINITYTYDLTWHYDPKYDQVVVTNAKFNISRGDPLTVSTAPGNGFWDTVTFTIPNAPLPHEEGVAIGDLPGVSGESLWNNFGATNYGILAFFSQNNKSEQYTIKYGSVTPYNVSRNSDGTFTLFVTEDRYNDSPDKLHIHPAWTHSDVKATVNVPAVPIRKTTTTHFCYDV